MTGHVRWNRTRAKPSLDPTIHREQMAYTRGYLLALDDMLKDLEKYRSTLPDGKGLGDPHLALIRFADIILMTRRQALHTERALLLAYQDKEVPEAQPKPGWAKFSGQLEPEEEA